MSGICGLASFDGSQVERRELEGMMAAAAHRAADGVDTWHGPGIALARQATHLTPQDAMDRQPVVRDGYVLIADARIDNRDEVVPWLVRRGYLAGEVETTPDSVIILAAHRCWGDAAAAWLVGDFAYVLWDRLRRRLLAARDPMGMRPLYYRLEAGRRALFASELKQLLAVRGVPCTIDERGITATLAGPFLPPNATVYLGIDQLAPGCRLVVDAAGRRIERYWKPDPARYLNMDADQLVDVFRQRLARSVADRLRARQPVGLLLSGGVDSGSIASMAGWLRQRQLVGGPPLRTYSWAFPTLPDSDERAVSDRIVEHYGLDGIAVEGDDAWPLAGYPDHGPDRDDPYMWVYQALVERTVARCAADGTGLLMSGDRGDELLGDWAFDETGLLRARKLAAFASEVRAGAAEEGEQSLLGALRRNVLRPRLTHRAPRLARLWASRHRGPRPWAPWVPEEVARRINLDDIVAESKRLPHFDGYARSVRLHRLLDPQMARIAVLRNRTRARLGIGFADPFADRRLVELILSVPQWQVHGRARPKRLAREAMRGVMPEDARRRLAKTIPASLYDRGFRDRGVGTVRALLTDSRAARHGWLNGSVALAAHEQYVRTGTSPFDLWWALTVEFWLRRWWD